MKSPLQSLKQRTALIKLPHSVASLQRRHEQSKYLRSEIKSVKVTILGPRLSYSTYVVLESPFHESSIGQGWWGGKVFLESEKMTSLLKFTIPLESSAVFYSCHSMQISTEQSTLHLLSKSWAKVEKTFSSWDNLKFLTVDLPLCEPWLVHTCWMLLDWQSTWNHNFHFCCSAVQSKTIAKHLALQTQWWDMIANIG